MIFGLLVTLVTHLATSLVLPGSPLFVVDALSAVADAIACVAPFALGYWGGRFCTRRSALSSFLRCSVHGGRESVGMSWGRSVASVSTPSSSSAVATLYNPARLRLCEVASEALVFSEQRGDFLNLFKQRGATASVFEPVGVAKEASGSSAVCIVNVHLNLGCDAQRDSQASEAVALGRRTAAAVAVASGCSSVGVAMLGDFNAHESEATVSRMAAVHGFVDAVAASGCAGAPRLTWSADNPLTHGTLREPDGCIDYVLSLIHI